MTFHHVLKMAVATAWFNMASTAQCPLLREEYLDRLVRSCFDDGTPRWQDEMEHNGTTWITY